MTESEIKNTPYAGFLLRLAAYFVDNFIISLFNIYLLFPVLRIYGVKLPIVPPFDEMIKSMQEKPGITVFELMGITPADFVLFMLATLLTEWLYFAGMESSPKQGTLGKMLLRLKVTTMGGEPLSFLRASGRYFSKIISRLTLMIGFIMAAFTEKKQALHDMMAGCLVLKKNA